MIYLGLAGWSISREVAERFPGEGAHLERYARRFPAVEINSSFYRPHRPQTYARWAASTPAGFRFAVKVPRLITHESRLKEVAGLDRFIPEAAALDEKLGPLLVQLPPNLPFDAARAGEFFAGLRQRFEGLAACEPRHASWYTPEAESLLIEHRMARVAAHPAPHPLAGEPAAWAEPVYYRLHGAPQLYYSSYTKEELQSFAEKLIAAEQRTGAVWCIFNNTAAGAAVENAFELMEML
jgi:uncharacterized protein YecE (DUF72 family)